MIRSIFRRRFPSTFGAAAASAPALPRCFINTATASSTTSSSSHATTSGSSSMGQTFASAGYSDNLSTPSFGNIGAMPSPPDLGSIDTSPATDLSVARDLHGPWIFLAAPHLEGELFVRKDGIVFFRPGNQLGYGIGRVKMSPNAITGSAVAEMELETYLYAATSKDPPLAPRRFTFLVAFSVASAPKQNYKTLTMNGQSVDDGGVDAAGVGSVNAAKLEPWDATAPQNKPWTPNPQIAQGFEQLFPRPFSLQRLSSSFSSSSSSKNLLDLQQYKVGDIDSVYYVPDYVTEQEEAECIRQNAETPSELKNKLDRRVVQEYGGSMCGECQKSFVSDANIPPWTAAICKSLVKDSVFEPTTFPNNVRIHDYEVGHGIAPHCDGPIYVPRVAILSLKSPVLMSFYRRREPYEDVMQHYNDTFEFEGDIAKERPQFSVVLEPRSLLVFEKNAYHFHPHGIAAGERDSLDEAVVGPIVNRHLMQWRWQKNQNKNNNNENATKNEIVRDHRIGVTIRNLLPRCAHEPQRAEYQMLEAYKVKHAEFELMSEEDEQVATENPAYTASAGASSDNSTPLTTASTSTSAASSDKSNYYSAMSRSPSPTYSSSSSSSDIEHRLERIEQQQRGIESQLREIQQVLAFGAQRSIKFESDVAAVLDHVSQVVLDLQAGVEEVNENSRAGEKK